MELQGRIHRLGSRPIRQVSIPPWLWIEKKFSRQDPSCCRWLLPVWGLNTPHQVKFIANRKLRSVYHRYFSSDQSEHSITLTDQSELSNSPLLLFSRHRTDSEQNTEGNWRIFIIVYTFTLLNKTFCHKILVFLAGVCFRELRFNFIA